MAKAHALQMIRGDDFSLNIPVLAAAGGPADLSGATASFVYAATASGTPLNDGMASETPAIGSSLYAGATYPTVEVTIPASETEDLSAPLYHWACRVTKSGAVSTVAYGTIHVTPVPQ